MAVNETRLVRVATMKASGKRYLLDSFHGTKALLWGELVAFKGLRSEHRGKLTWVEEKLFTFKEEPKTVALMMALLKQAASADPALSIRIVAKGAALAYLNEAGDEVPMRVATKEPEGEGTKAVKAMVKMLGPALDKEARRAVLGLFMRRE